MLRAQCVLVGSGLVPRWATSPVSRSREPLVPRRFARDAVTVCFTPRFHDTTVWRNRVRRILEHGMLLTLCEKAVLPPEVVFLALSRVRSLECGSTNIIGVLSLLLRRLSNGSHGVGCGNRGCSRLDHHRIAYLVGVTMVCASTTSDMGGDDVAPQTRVVHFMYRP